MTTITDRIFNARQDYRNDHAGTVPDCLKLGRAEYAALLREWPNMGQPLPSSVDLKFLGMRVDPLPIERFLEVSVR